MNRITECSNPHTDDEHTGNAKRDSVNGVAGLDISGSLLSHGNAVSLVRGGDDFIYITERTSAQTAIRITRVGDNTFLGSINVGAAWSQILTANLKDVVNGVAGLDAAAKILNAQMPDLLIQSQTPQVLTGAGAISLTTAITHIVTASGADAVTLADGVEGQHKTIVMKTITTGGDTSIITPAHFANGTTITGNSVGDIQNMMFTNGAWHWTGGRGAVIA